MQPWQYKTSNFPWASIKLSKWAGLVSMISISLSLHGPKSQYGLYAVELGDRYQPCNFLLDLIDHWWGMFLIVHSCGNGLGLATTSAWADKKTKETVSKAPDRSTNNHQTQTSQHKPWMHAISAHCWQHPWGKCVHEKMSKAFEMTKWQNRKIAIQGAIIFDSILMFYHLLLMIIYARRHNSFGGMGRKMTGKLKRSKRSETVSKQTDSTGI